jgi:hypothetical protein
VHIKPKLFLPSSGFIGFMIILDTVLDDKEQTNTALLGDY